MRGEITEVPKGREYYVGDFGDARLKKAARCCIGGWLKHKAYVYGG